MIAAGKINPDLYFIIFDLTIVNLCVFNVIMIFMILLSDMI